MNRNAIRTDDQRLARNRLVELNRQKRFEMNQKVEQILEKNKFSTFVFTDSTCKSFKFISTNFIIKRSGSSDEYFPRVQSDVYFITR